METFIIQSKEAVKLERHKVNSSYRTKKRQVFLIGSKGIPANYGGFETFVEELTKGQKSRRIRYHVACLAKDSIRYEYNGAKCFHVKVPGMGPAKAVYYDMAALSRCIKYCRARPEIKKPVFYVLACRIGPFIGHFKRKIKKLGGELYVNPDGHEWKRAKWNALIRRYWKLSEKLMVKHADLLICDSRNIEKYIKKDYKQYRPKTVFIAYGSDTPGGSMSAEDEKLTQWYGKNGIEAQDYYLIVGRFVQENNYETIIREFMKTNTEKSLVIITNENKKFLQELKKRTGFEKDPRIKFAGTVYEQELLYKIRENAYAYIHGHEVGGTNPSLLEALGSTSLNLLLDVGFNREVGGKAALYWTKTEGNLAGTIDKAEKLTAKEIAVFGEKAKRRIAQEYRWEDIVDRYEEVFLKYSS